MSTIETIDIIFDNGLVFTMHLRNIFVFTKLKWPCLGTVYQRHRFARPLKRFDFRKNFYPSSVNMVDQVSLNATKPALPPWNSQSIILERGDHFLQTVPTSAYFLSVDFSISLEFGCQGVTQL